MGHLEELCFGYTSIFVCSIFSEGFFGSDWVVPLFEMVVDLLVVLVVDVLEVGEGVFEEMFPVLEDMETFG